MKMKKCKIPVALILFKRIDTLERIVSVIRKVSPTKIYLLSDQGRNQEEREQVTLVRKKVEALIDWDCEVVKYYAEENRGVFENIGLGAKWVFSQEKTCIFLEDDNLPDVTFFQYCEELLSKYQDNDDVLWICGTNYLGEYENSAKESYFFTKHLLPCGWASWSEKFLKYYDFYFDKYHDKSIDSILRTAYKDSNLLDQQRYTFEKEIFYKKKIGHYLSWDYQMAFSLRYFDKLGISPSRNLIENIGVDNISEHGGNSFDKIMTARFCGVPCTSIDFPLNHPVNIEVDKNYEKLIDDIIRLPLMLRLRNKLKRVLFSLLGFEPYLSPSLLKKEIYSKFKNLK